MVVNFQKEVMSVAISVVIPIHNAEVELERCLKSVLEQSFELNYEVLCILDGSNTKTYQIVQDFYQEYPRKIKIFETNFFDPGLVRNFGIEQSQGEYIFFVDGDDFLEEECLEDLYNKANKSKAEVVIGNYYNFYPKINKRRTSSFLRNFLSQKNYTSKEVAYKVIKDFRVRGYVWNTLYKREMIIKNKIRFIPTKLAIEDRPFLVECCLCANKIFISKTKIYNYVQHSTSFVKSTNKLYFLQKALNCDFALKIILLHHNCYEETDFKKLLSFHLRGITSEAKRICSALNIPNKVLLDEIKKQKLVINGDDLYVYDSPWEGAIKALRFNEELYRKLPPSFQIKDLTKVL